MTCSSKWWEFSWEQRQLVIHPKRLPQEGESDEQVDSYAKQEK